MAIKSLLVVVQRGHLIRYGRRVVSGRVEPIQHRSEVGAINKRNKNRVPDRLF